jgi:RNA polymerase sigma-70 factor (ECF subfamily)
LVILDFRLSRGVAVLAYWYPLYAFARRARIHPHDAEDLVQGFFLHLIRDEALASADPSRGRLRTFFLTLFRNHIADESRRRGALKRGGAHTLVPLDGDWAERRLALEGERNLDGDAERAHDRRWALLLVERALHRLESERAASGHGDEMRALAPFLDIASGGVASYAKASAALGWTINATCVAVFRLRRRFRDLLLATVADTLEHPDPEAIEAEMRELILALGDSPV